MFRIQFSPQRLHKAGEGALTPSIVKLNQFLRYTTRMFRSSFFICYEESCSFVELLLLLWGQTIALPSLKLAEEELSRYEGVGWDGRGPSDPSALLAREVLPADGGGCMFVRPLMLLRKSRCAQIWGRFSPPQRGACVLKCELMRRRR